MKQQWLAYVVVGVLSIGAGVAIAGLPDDVPVAATIATSEPTVAPETTATDTTVPSTTVAETVPATTQPDTTVSTTEPDTTVSTTEPDTGPDTTGPDTTDLVPIGLPARSELNVAAVNGANVAGAASRAAARLQEVGYVDVLPLNGADIFEFTVIFFTEGLDEAALRLAEDLDLLPDFVAPLDTLPAVADLPADIELVAYIGRDRA